MRVLENLDPNRVFRYFEDICSIPHGSGNTKAISDYCASFAEKHGLNYIQDEHNNIIIKKPASNGYENHNTVILQGHLDMVCEKDADINFDFSSDGLKLYINGDYISAHGTTLGGDDGIAVAMGLAILEDSSLPHPALEVLFTADEETGMYGADGLDASLLTGKILINADSEDEGVLTVGCAGGARAEVNYPVEFNDTDKDFYKIIISGLIGGHSGIEINKGRLNANKLLAKFLTEVGEFQIANISGGAKDNVIPNRSECIIATDFDIFTLTEAFKNENYTENDSGLEIKIEKCEKMPVIDSYNSKRIIDMLNEFPDSVQKMSDDIKTLVQTSLNLGVIEIENGIFRATFSVRSSVNKEKTELLKKLEDIAEKYNASYSEHGHYPAWEYRRNSPLRDTMVEVFEKLYNQKPVIDVIHAGLECGIFCDKIPGLDAVSFGPNMKDIHTSREMLSISSVNRTYKYLCEILKAL